MLPHTGPMTTVRIDRRSILAGVGAGCLLAALPGEAKSSLLRSPRGNSGGYVSARDGTQIFFKDWGDGPTVVFSHGWPLNADAWDDQMYFLASSGFRCIAFDRRGHGRSGPAWNGHDYDTFAHDLKMLLEQLDLKNVILIGHSAGGGDVARYIGRQGTGRVAKVVLVSAIPPLMLKTADNPDGVPLAVFDGIRKAVSSNRAQFYHELAEGPFYGGNRPGANVSQGVKDALWLWCMQVGLRAAYEGIKAFSETDFSQDLKRFDVPTLIIHGEDDQNVTIANSAFRTANLVPHAALKIYEKAPHGLMVTHKERFNADLLDFTKQTA